MSPELVGALVGGGIASVTAIIVAFMGYRHSKSLGDKAHQSSLALMELAQRADRDRAGRQVRRELILSAALDYGRGFDLVHTHAFTSVGFRHMTIRFSSEAARQTLMETIDGAAEGQLLINSAATKCQVLGLPSDPFTKLCAEIIENSKLCADSFVNPKDYSTKRLDALVAANDVAHAKILDIFRQWHDTEM
jgi:hypothetical protein